MTSESKIVPANNADIASTNVVALPHRPEPITPSDKVLHFVKEHPVLIIAGGVAVGLVVSALIPRSFGRKLARRTLGLAEAGATAALAIGHDTMDKAEEGGVVARKKAKVLAAQAEKFSGKAVARAEALADKAAARAEKLGERAAVHAEKLGVVALDRASAFGHAAADHAERLGHVAAARAENLGERASDRLSQFGDKALSQSSKLFGHPKAPQGLADRVLDRAHDLRARISA